MKYSRKVEVVERLAERLSGVTSMYLASFTGVGVQSMTQLRRQLRAAGGEYVVVKNTLALRAFEAATVTGIDTKVLTGPTAIVFTGADPAASAKVLNDFQREHEGLTLKAGLLDGQPISSKEIKRIAVLPSRDQLLGQAAGVFQSPLQGMVGVLNGVLYQMVGVLDALKAQRATAETQV
ncbi:MAG: 50S ribosomal protein L10 [Gemmatimonadales bacterium]